MQEKIKLVENLFVQYGDFMSRVGKKIINIPKDVKVSLNGALIKVVGPKGTLEKTLPNLVTVNIENSIIKVVSAENKALHGLARNLINNMVIGVVTPFSRELELQGVGYKVELQTNNLIFSLGFSHDIKFELPKGITAEVGEKKNKVAIFGSDKELVGLLAEKIRSLRPPEPYKGKGIRYLGEIIKKKAGKQAASATATKA